MSSQPGIKQRLQYAFDNLMAAGAPAMIALLTALSALVIGFASLLVILFGLAPEGSPPITFGEAAWMSLMRTLDAGTMGSDTGTGLRLVMFFVTIGGVFIVSTLIGVLGAAVQTRLDDLRKGRSLVLEQGHTVILGWSPQIFTILAELIEANANQKRAAIAILADRDKVEMEDELRARLPKRKTTRIICRSGQPNDPTTIEIVNPRAARSIIILPPEEDSPDNFVIKTILSITNHPNRRPESYNIVTQLQQPASLDAARILSQRDTLGALFSGDLIARIVAQTSRQSGLSAIYTELLNFSGDEIYIQEEPALSGRRYAEALAAYEDSCVLGLMLADGTARLNPPMQTRIAPDDKLIALTADDDTLRLAGLKAPAIPPDLIQPAAPPPPALPEKALLLGWNACAPDIIRHLDSYASPGSLLQVVASPERAEEIRACRPQRQRLEFQPGDTASRALLDALRPELYDHVIVLADTSLTAQQADARTLMTLLHLRDIATQASKPFSIVSEMLDLRNRQLAEITRVDDFIVSEHLLSLMTAQLSESPALKPVFEELFSAEGMEIYLKAVAGYVKTGQPVNFYTVLEAASRRGETALGYRLAAQHDDAAQAYGVHLNPRKSTPITFAPEDKIIVLAES